MSTLKVLTATLVMTVTCQFSLAYAATTYPAYSTSSSNPTAAPTVTASPAPQTAPESSSSPVPSSQTSTGWMSSGPLSTPQATSSPAPMAPQPASSPVPNNSQSAPSPASPANLDSGNGTTTQILSTYPDGSVKQKSVVTSVTNGNFREMTTELITLNQTGEMTALSGQRTVSDSNTDPDTGEMIFNSIKTYEIFGVPAANGTVTSSERLLSHTFYEKVYTTVANGCIPKKLVEIEVVNSQSEQIGCPLL